MAYSAKKCPGAGEVAEFKELHSKNSGTTTNAINNNNEVTECAQKFVDESFNSFFVDSQTNNKCYGTSDDKNTDATSWTATDKTFGLTCIKQCPAGKVKDGYEEKENGKKLVKGITKAGSKDLATCKADCDALQMCKAFSHDATAKDCYLSFVAKADLTVLGTASDLETAGSFKYYEIKCIDAPTTTPAPTTTTTAAATPAGSGAGSGSGASTTPKSAASVSAASAAILIFLSAAAIMS